MSHNKEVIDVIGRLEEGVKAILNSKGKWWEKLEEVIKIVTPEVEIIGAAWRGSEKKLLAQEIVEDLWFRFLDIKYIPNALERIIVNKVSSFLIDKVVKFFNEKGIFKHRSK